MVSLLDRATMPAHVLVRFLDRECVLLNLETEQYFGLDETGTRMWQLVTASPSIDVAFHELLAEFDVEPELLRSNLTDLLDRLIESGLLQVRPANVGTVSAI
jgi:hypothetical protein